MIKLERQGEPSLGYAQSINQSVNQSINQYEDDEEEESLNQQVTVLNDYSDMDLPPLPPLPDLSNNQSNNEQLHYAVEQMSDDSDYESDDQSIVQVVDDSQPISNVNQSINQSIPDVNQSINQSINQPVNHEDDQSFGHMHNQSISVLPDDDEEEINPVSKPTDLTIILPSQSISQSSEPSINQSINHSVAQSHNPIPNELNLSYDESREESSYPSSLNPSINQSNSPNIDRFPTHQSFNLSIYRTNQSNNFNTANSSDLQRLSDFDASPRSINQSNNPSVDQAAVFDVSYDDDEEEKYEYKESINRTTVHSNQSINQSINHSLQSPLSLFSNRSSKKSINHSINQSIDQTSNDNISGTTVLIDGTLNQPINQSIMLCDQTLINQSINYTTEMSSSIQYAPSNYGTINQSINQSMQLRASSEPARLSYSHQSINQSINHTDIAHHRNGSESYIYQTFLPINQSVDQSINESIHPLSIHPLSSQSINQSFHEHIEIKEGESDWTEDEPGMVLSINQSVNPINQPIHQSLDQSINQSVHPSINQSISQSIDQSFDQSIKEQPNYQYNPNDWDYEIEGIEMVNQSKEGEIHRKSINQSINQSQEGQIRQPKSINQSVKHFPLFTIALSIGQLVVFLLMFSSSDWLIDRYSINPLIGPPVQSIIQYGAKFTPRLIDYQYWRLFTNLFLNGSIVQFLGSLSLIGSLVYVNETKYGTLVVFFHWLIGGLMGQLLSCLMGARLIDCGAYSTLFGLMAIYWIETLYKYQSINESIKYNYPINQSINQNVLICQILHFCIGACLFIFPYVDGWSMIGSLIGCACMSVLTINQSVNQLKNMFLDRIAAIKVCLMICALFILIGGFIALPITINQSINQTNNQSINLYENWCPACHWIACIETSSWTCQSIDIPDNCWTTIRDESTQGWC